MFVKLVNHAAGVEVLYECASVTKEWVPFKTPKDQIIDKKTRLVITMAGPPNDAMLKLEPKGCYSIYYMNKDGRTIDSISW